MVQSSSSRTPTRPRSLADSRRAAQLVGQCHHWSLDARKGDLKRRTTPTAWRAASATIALRLVLSGTADAGIAQGSTNACRTGAAPPLLFLGIERPVWLCFSDHFICSRQSRVPRRSLRLQLTVRNRRRRPAPVGPERPSRRDDGDEASNGAWVGRSRALGTCTTTRRD